VKVLSAALALPLLGLLLEVGAGAGQGAPGRAASGRREALPRKEARAPDRLSQTGLTARDGAIAAGLHAFSPQYPLWSDGAAKSRWILLPPGTRVDVRDGDAWDFPVGTKFWKEFRIGGLKAETRFIWRASATQWVFASYAWRKDQAEADLAPEAGLPSVAALGNGKVHDIPSVADCRACHVNGGPPVLGFNALQLSDDRDPNAPHAEALEPGMLTLSRLEAEGLLQPRRPEWTARPPRIPAADPIARAALGYLAANCGNCHRTTASGTALGTVDLAFDHRLAALKLEEEPGWATTVGRAGQWKLPGEGGSTLRVAPGAPERSTLLHRMASRRPASQMPPLGSVLADEAGLALMRRWIEGTGSPGAAERKP
jgi:hypothetical protein